MPATRIAFLFLLLSARSVAAQTIRPLDGVTPIVMRPPEQCVGVVRPETAGRGPTPGYEPVRPQNHVAAPAELGRDLKPGDTITIQVVFSLTGTVDSVRILGARNARVAADAAAFIRRFHEQHTYSPARYNGCPVRGLDESRVYACPRDDRQDLSTVLPGGALAREPVVQGQQDACVGVVRPPEAGRSVVPDYKDVTPHIVVIPPMELIAKLRPGDSLTTTIIYSVTGSIDSVTITGVSDVKAASKAADQLRKTLSKHRYSPATYNGCVVRGIHQYNASAGPDGFGQRRPLQPSWKNP